jgi:hypothetical protein
MRAIPENNLGYPVLVTLDNGSTGSGFYLHDDPYLHFVTAKHVLFDNKSGNLLADIARLTSYGNDLNDKSKMVLTLDLRALLDHHLVTDTKRDLAIVRLARRAVDPYREFAPGVTIISESRSGVVAVHRDNIRKFDEILISNQVVIFGYPISLGLKNLPQIDYERPLLRKGIVAGKNEAQGTIILDCPAYAGNSGGLVLEIEQDPHAFLYRAIGLVSQFVPAIQPWFDMKGEQAGTGVVNSGYSIATPIDSAIDLAHSLPSTT